MVLLWLPAMILPLQDVQSNWLKLGRGKDGTAFAIDDSTIRLKSDGVVEAWTRRDPLPGRAYAFEKILVEFNCDARTSKYIAAISYLLDGTIGTSNYDPEKRFLPVIPNSIEWVTMEHVCKIAKPAPAR